MQLKPKASKKNVCNTKQHQLSLAVTQFHRAPQIQELFFNGIHETTQSYESGDPNLNKEILFGDFTRGTFNQGGDVPRMRYGFQLSYEKSEWSTDVRLTREEPQNHAGENQSHPHRLFVTESGCSIPSGEFL